MWQIRKELMANPELVDASSAKRMKKSHPSENLVSSWVHLYWKTIFQNNKFRRSKISSSYLFKVIKTLRYLGSLRIISNYYDHVLKMCTKLIRIIFSRKYPPDLPTICKSSIYTFIEIQIICFAIIITLLSL